jgi:hypothetical protein
MRKLLLHLDSSRHASVFDRIVAYDAGAEEVLSYGGVEVKDARDLLHGCIFTRAPKNLRYTACFIGGADITTGERLLEAARQSFFGPFQVSLMLDSNGSNTTAVAAVEKILSVLPELRGASAVVTAGTGPVGRRVAGLLSRAGADVIVTSRSAAHGEDARRAIVARFGGHVSARAPRDDSELGHLLASASILCNCGPAGVRVVSRESWSGRLALRVAIDLNAVPPSGIEGIEPMDDGVIRESVACFGALAVGGFKMKIHRACIARLFESNDVVLDAEAIAELARSLATPPAAA